MKARVKKTGNIINVIPEQGGWCDTDFKSYSQHYEDKELDFEFQDWELFRREAAKDILIGICANWGKGFAGKISDMPDRAIELVDALIAKLKEK